MQAYNDKNFVTSAPIVKTLLALMVPYLATVFLQSALTLTDTFIVSRFCPTSSVSAVTVAGQVIHFFTTFAASLTIGSTVIAGSFAGSKKPNSSFNGNSKPSVNSKRGDDIKGDKSFIDLKKVKGLKGSACLQTAGELTKPQVAQGESSFLADRSLKKSKRGARALTATTFLSGEDLFSSITKSTLLLFLPLALVASGVGLLFLDKIVSSLVVPIEAVADTKVYLAINISAFVFVMAVNGVSSLFRGAGDFGTPLVAISAGVLVNIVLDVLLVGILKKGVAGAAFATVAGNALSAALLLFFVRSKLPKLRRGKVRLSFMKKMLLVGVPVAVQDALIQISFLVITRIANSLGVTVSAAVGITERVIGFLFLVNSAVLQAVCVATSQNLSAGVLKRARSALFWGVVLSVDFGTVVALLCALFSPNIIAFFTADSAVITLGATYLKSYSLDCVLAAVHFAFSGFFTGSSRSSYSFIHNALSALFVRIPLAALAASRFSGSLFQMGLAAPLGSAVSCLICILMYKVGFSKLGEKSRQR